MFVVCHWVTSQVDSTCFKRCWVTGVSSWSQGHCWLHGGLGAECQMVTECPCGSIGVGWSRLAFGRGEFALRSLRLRRGFSLSSSLCVRGDVNVSLKKVGLVLFGIRTGWSFQSHGWPKQCVEEPASLGHDPAINFETYKSNLAHVGATRASSNVLVAMCGNVMKELACHGHVMGKGVSPFGDFAFSVLPSL